MQYYRITVKKPSARLSGLSPLAEGFAVTPSSGNSVISEQNRHSRIRSFKLTRDVAKLNTTFDTQLLGLQNSGR